MSSNKLYVDRKSFLKLPVTFIYANDTDEELDKKGKHREIALFDVRNITAINSTPKGCVLRTGEGLFTCPMSFESVETALLELGCNVTEVKDVSINKLLEG